MDFDFSLILTLAVLASGLLWALDAVLLKPRRVAGQRQPWLFEQAQGFFPVLAVVWFLRSFLAEPFTIPSGSMLPSLEVGDYVLVNKFSYGVRLPVLGTQIIAVGQPQRGDVMVFRFPLQPSVNYIKRVVGLPGDRIESRGEVLFVNGVEMPRTLVSQQPAVEPWEQVWREDLSGHSHITREEIGRAPAGTDWQHVVPAGHYFMMGDNRDNSNDSRFWGTVPESLIVGKAFFIWMHKKPGLHLPEFGRNGSIE